MNIHPLSGVLQQSETPSPAKESHGRSSGSAVSHAVCESPALVSPGKDLIAQTGAMLLDNPSLGFNSPCHRFHPAPSAGDLLDLTGHRPPSRQHSSTEAHSSRAVAAQNGTAASTANMSSSADRQQHRQTQRAFVAPCHQDQPLPQSSTVRYGEEQEWCSGATTTLPESMLAAPEEMARLRTSPVPMLQTDQAMRLQAGTGSTQLAMQMLPAASSTYPPQTGFRWDPAYPDMVLPAGLVPGMYATDMATTSTQSAFLPALMLQRQQAQGEPSHSLGQPLGVQGSAMEQLALSTAATADLLAGMAANSSQSYPGSASDLILAASATLQAFARAAHSAQGNPFGVQPGVGQAGNMVLGTSTPMLGYAPDQQQQQIAFMQQQWQLQQQQQSWFGVNGAAQHPG